MKKWRKNGRAKHKSSQRKNRKRNKEALCFIHMFGYLHVVQAAEASLQKFLTCLRVLLS